jgi:hypothetical protein
MTSAEPTPYLTAQHGEHYATLGLGVLRLVMPRINANAQEQNGEGAAKSAEMWISPDPARQFASPYSYAGNGVNPINFTDNDGNCLGAFLVPCIAGAVAGGVGVYWMLGALKTSERVSGQTQANAQQMMNDGDLVGSALEIQKIGADKSLEINADVGTGSLLTSLLSRGQPKADAVGTGVKWSETVTSKATTELAKPDSFASKAWNSVKSFFGSDVP